MFGQESGSRERWGKTCPSAVWERLRERSGKNFSCYSLKILTEKVSCKGVNTKLFNSLIDQSLSLLSFAVSEYGWRILLFTARSHEPSGWLMGKVIIFNNNSSSHLLSTYYEPGSLQSTFCALTYRIFTIMLGGQVLF